MDVDGIYKGKREEYLTGAYYLQRISEQLSIARGRN
jgi:hypothetical protein